MSDDEKDEIYQSAVDELDVKYIDGRAYMNVHTIDVICGVLENTTQLVAEKLQSRGEELPPGFINGVTLCLDAWYQLHDELVVRETVQNIPDFVPEDLKE